MLVFRHLLFPFAAAIIALFAMPEIALAHTGHAHTSQASFDARSTGGTPSSYEVVALDELRSQFVNVARAAGSSSDRGCVSGCCGGMSSIGCCSIALISLPVEILPLRRSAVLTPLDFPIVPGLAPEALPKPPKSIA